MEHGTSDEDESLWGYVDINTERSENEDSDNGSMVMVSRCMLPTCTWRCLAADKLSLVCVASSPWPVKFCPLQSTNSRPVKINWPLSMPWFQAQSIYFKSTRSIPSHTL